MAMPFQKQEKLPATRPERMVSEAPPSREALTISATWREFELVNTLVSSGITAAASVPHEMMIESFHHSPRPGRPGALRHAEGDQDGDQRGDPHQAGERVLEVDLVLARVLGARQRAVDL